MKRLVFTILFAVTPLLCGPQTNAKEAASVWEKVLAAKGGRERLHSIENVLRSSRIPSKLEKLSFDRQVEELFIFPSKYWQWADESPTIFGRSASTLDFESKINYFMWDTDAVARKSIADPKEERWRFEFLQALEFLETRWMNLEPVRTWSEKDGRRVSVLVECRVRMSTGWAPVTFSLDSQTLLPNRAVVSEPLINDKVVRLIFDFSEYSEVDGVKMPGLIRHSGDNLKFEEKLTYRFNVDYEPELFRTGPVVEDGPAGWRKRSK